MLARLKDIARRGNFDITKIDTSKLSQRENIIINKMTTPAYVGLMNAMEFLKRRGATQQSETLYQLADEFIIPCQKPVDITFANNSTRLDMENTTKFTINDLNLKWSQPTYLYGKTKTFGRGKTEQQTSSRTDSSSWRRPRNQGHNHPSLNSPEPRQGTNSNKETNIDVGIRKLPFDATRHDQLIPVQIRFSGLEVHSSFAFRSDREFVELIEDVYQRSQEQSAIIHLSSKDKEACLNHA